MLLQQVGPGFILVEIEALDGAPTDGEDAGGNLPAPPAYKKQGANRSRGGLGSRLLPPLWREVVQAR
jgi:hypothetical protein